MKRPRIFAVGAAAVLGIASSAIAAQATDPSRVMGVPISGLPKAGTPLFTGKWINATPEIGLKTVAGTEPPLNAAGKALYGRHRANDRTDDPNKLCQMHGYPRLLYTSMPFVIAQYEKHVDFIHEPNHTFRIVQFGAKEDPDADPWWLGHPSASWDGHTLVIDSAEFNDRTWLDYQGLPHGEKLRVQERYTLAADGRTINGTVRIEDSDYYSQPWTTAFILRKLPGLSLREHACMADHRM